MPLDRVTRLVPETIRSPSTRLLSEYVRAKFPHYLVFLAQPVGPALPSTPRGPRTEQTLRSSLPWQLEVDALVIMAPPEEVRIAQERTIAVVLEVPPGTTLLLIEAKIRQVYQAIGMLQLYRELVPETPSLNRVSWGEVRTRLVAPRIGEWVAPIAERLRVELDPYEPDWIRDYWAWVDGYWTRAYRREREQVIAARARLGLR